MTTTRSARVATLICLLALLTIFQSPIGHAQQAPAENWGSEYLLTYFSLVAQGDEASGSLTFAPSWGFRILNSMDGRLYNPTITVTTPLFGSLTPHAWNGSFLSEEPSNNAYVWTRPEGYLPAATEQPNWGLQADLDSAEQVYYPLGFTLIRLPEGGQRIEAGSTMTRTFTLTLTLSESAREFGGEIVMPVDPSLPIQVVSGFETCASSVGTVTQSSDPSRPGVSWSAPANATLFQPGDVFTLSCNLTLHNTTASPALFTPIAAMTVGQLLVDYGYQPSDFILINSNDVAPPPDPLDGSARFQVTGESGRQLFGVSAKRFFRRVMLAFVNRSTDMTPPMTSAVLSPAANASGWNNAPVTVTLTATDEPDGSGVKQITYTITPPGQLNGQQVTVLGHTVTFTVNYEGQFRIDYYATDNVGNVEPAKNVWMKIDTRAPTVSATPIRPPIVINGQNWWNLDITINLTASDVNGPSCSNVKQIWYRTDGAQSQPLTAVPGGFVGVLISLSGTTTVSYYAEDYAGNVSATQTYVVNMDRDGPVVTPDVTPAPNGQGWNNISPTTVSLSATDAGTGVQRVGYSIEGGQWVWTTGSATSVSITTPGSTQVSYQAQDNAGNYGFQRWLTVKIDTVPPMMGTLWTQPGPKNINGQNWWNSDVTVNVGGYDVCPNCSGMRRIWYSLEGAQSTQQPIAINGSNGSFTLTVEGTTTITYWAEDNAGNLSGKSTYVVNLDKTAPVVTLSSASSVNEGAVLAISATVSGGGDLSTWGWSVQSGGGALTPSTDRLSATYQRGNAPATVTVQLVVPDGHGNSTTATVTFQVINLPPTVTMPGNIPPINEGALLNAAGTFSDPGVRDIARAASVDYGDGLGVQQLVVTQPTPPGTSPPSPYAPGSFSLNHKYGKPGTYTVTVTITDSGGATGTGTCTVTVQNVAPTVYFATPPAGTPSPAIDEGHNLSELPLTGGGGGGFVDPSGTNETYTAIVSYGDGSPQVQLTLLPGQYGATNLFAFDHIYAQAGTYSLVVTVTDSNGGVGTGTMTVLVFAYPAGPAGGDFVIGDLNAVVGNQVTFWGAQWAKLNSLSGGAAPSSFKGFAESTSTEPPVSGGTWTSDPGNSSGPPASIPSYIAVIVSSSITKSGSTIAGDIQQVAIIRTNPGYDSNPGHAGTGTVVAVISQ